MDILPKMILIFCTLPSRHALGQSRTTASDGEVTYYIQISAACEIIIFMHLVKLADGLLSDQG